MKFKKLLVLAPTIGLVGLVGYYYGAFSHSGITKALAAQGAPQTTAAQSTTGQVEIQTLKPETPAEWNAASASTQTGSSQTASTQTDSTQADSTQTDSAQADSTDAESDQNSETDAQITSMLQRDLQALVDNGPQKPKKVHPQKKEHGHGHDHENDQSQQDDGNGDD